MYQVVRLVLFSYRQCMLAFSACHFLLCAGYQSTSCTFAWLAYPQFCTDAVLRQCRLCRSGIPLCSTSLRCSAVSRQDTFRECQLPHCDRDGAAVAARESTRRHHRELHGTARHPAMAPEGAAPGPAAGAARGARRMEARAVRDAGSRGEVELCPRSQRPRNEVPPKG